MKTLRIFVIVTPLLGAIVLPLAIPLTIAKFGVSYGVAAALLLSILWFVAMLRTSEMPH